MSNVWIAANATEVALTWDVQNPGRTWIACTPTQTLAIKLICRTRQLVGLGPVCLSPVAALDLARRRHTAGLCIWQPATKDFEFVKVENRNFAEHRFLSKRAKLTTPIRTGKN